MSELNINVEGGSSTKLLTAGKYCPNDIIITASGGGGAEVEPIVLSGLCEYSCSGSVAGAYINLYGDSITTNGITDARYMFYKNSCKEIPFEINMDNSQYRSMGNMFEECRNLEELPKINNAYPDSLRAMFKGCKKLRHIPDECFNNWYFGRVHTYRYAYSDNVFSNCNSLRSISETFLNNLYGQQETSSTPYYGTFAYCYVLDEINGMGVSSEGVTFTKNSFNSSTFTACYRLKNFTFKTKEDGSPIVAKWNSQIIDLSDFVGYVPYYSHSKITDSGISSDKRVKDATTYEALKNDDDYWTDSTSYSRFNHDSAVYTINSLPDTSAFLSESGGTTNTIKFEGLCGALTDGGAINTLTDAEIAVAAAKGWTVTLV